MSEWLKPGGYIFGNFFILPEDFVKTLTNNSLVRGLPIYCPIDWIPSMMCHHFVFSTPQIKSVGG
jgi:hypothetical protein